MSRYFLATADPEFEHRLRTAFAGTLNGDLKCLNETFLDLHPSRAVAAVTSDPSMCPDVIVIGPGIPVVSVLALAEEFEAQRPEINVVIVARPTPKLWEKALRAGVRDIVTPTASDADLKEALERAGHSAVRRRANLTGEGTGQQSSIITVVSPKGGSGKTTIATNVAVGLGQLAPNQVVLVDLDLLFGDVASALRLAPEHTMADVSHDLANVDPIALKVFLTPHPSGIYALCAPDSPEEGEQVTEEQSSTILRLLATEFRYVVVDTSAGLSDHTLAALELSTDIVAVCTMDVPSVRSLRKVVTTFDHLDLTRQRRHFVLNRAHTKVGLDPDDIERTVGLQIDVAIPSSREVPLSMNQGEPLILSTGRSAVAKEFRRMVQRFVPADALSAGKALEIGGRA